MAKIIDYLKEKIPYEIRYILILFVVTRIVLTIIGVSSQMMLDEFHGQEYTWQYSEYKVLDIWGVWDSGYYLSIAEHGYSTDLGQDPLTQGQANYGFFPLYPLLIKALGTIIGSNYLAGIIVSNIFLIISCIFLFKLVRLKSDQDTALGSIKYLFLFPSVFILSGVFSESLFLSLVAMSFYYAQKENWLAVGITGCLAALTKSIGVFIILPFLFEYFRHAEFKIRNIKPSILFLLLIPLGLFGFSVYSYHLTGDFLAFIHVQQTGWLHIFTNPFQVLFNSIFTKDIFRLINGLLASILIIFLTLKIKKINFAYWLLGMLLLFLPLTSGIVSINSILRYMLPIFPIYILLAKINKTQLGDQLTITALAILQGFFMVFWSNGFHLIV